MNSYHDFMTYTQVPRFSYPFHCKIYQYVLFFGCLVTRLAKNEQR